MSHNRTFLILVLSNVISFGLFAQERIQVLGGIQLKKGFIYNNDLVSSNSSSFTYETDAFDTQYDLLVKYFLKDRTNLYTGLAIGYSSHTCILDVKETSNKEDARFRSEIMSFKMPLRLGYFCTPKVELLLGVCYNLSALSQQSASSVLFNQSNLSLIHTYSSSWNYFSTGSLQAGLQVYPGARLSLFAICDLDFGKYPESKIFSVVEAPNQTPQFYYNSYRPSLFMISLGFSYKLFARE